jgi:hypothetical protein
VQETDAQGSEEEVSGSALRDADDDGGDRTGEEGGSRVELITADGLPGEAYAELTPDGAWSWFGDPRAVCYEGERRCTYAGCVTSSGDVVVAQYDHDTGEIVSTVVKEELQRDDHASPALLVRPDGRLMVFYCGHRGRWLIFRISEQPEDVSSWGSEYAASGHTSEVWGYTYPSAFILAGEADRRYLFWRGREYLPTFSTSETGMSWSESRVLIDGDGEQPYVKYASDGDRSIHIAFTQDHPGKDEHNNVYYVRYEDGMLRRADGSVIAPIDSLPIRPADADLVYDAAESGARAWLWDLAFDENGWPVIAYAAFPSLQDHRYRYARWNGSEWTDEELASAGGRFPSVLPYYTHFEPYYSGGMALDAADPSVVYLSRPIDGVFEIERWTREASGGWSPAAVTRGSSANNVRPVVPVGRAGSGSRGGPDAASGAGRPVAPEVIWMHGEYHDFTRYSTGLRMK